MMKQSKVLLIHDGVTAMPDDAGGTADPLFSTELSVLRTIRNRGHEVRTLPFYDDVMALVSEIRAFAPDVVFNLAEACLGEYCFDRSLPSFLELMRVPYTGCGPAGLMICNNKALTKKVLTYHRIKVPRFCVFKKGESVRFPADFHPPFFIKPLKEEASTGITRDSLADNEKSAADRVCFVHERLDKDAIVEEYIDGRELYVGVMGNKSVTVLPVWEMKFANVPANEPKIATYRVKWDDNYRKKWGIHNEYADPFPAGVEARIRETCRIAYRVLNLDGYVRFDLRLTAAGEVYIIEANANPDLTIGEDFAASADKAGISYDDLIEKIMKLALRREE